MPKITTNFDLWLWAVHQQQPLIEARFAREDRGLPPDPALERRWQKICRIMRHHSSYYWQRDFGGKQKA